MHFARTAHSPADERWEHCRRHSDAWRAKRGLGRQRSGHVRRLGHVPHAPRWCALLSLMVCGSIVAHRRLLPASSRRAPLAPGLIAIHFVSRAREGVTTALVPHVCKRCVVAASVAKVAFWSRGGDVLSTSFSRLLSMYRPQLRTGGRFVLGAGAVGAVHARRKHEGARRPPQLMTLGRPCAWLHHRSTFGWLAASSRTAGSCTRPSRPVWMLLLLALRRADAPPRAA